MDAILYDLCKTHNLTGIGVNVFGAPEAPYIGVYVHWDDLGGLCASGSAQTFDEALACALAEMNERRQPSDNPGFCLACGAEADGVEPDARDYECEACGDPLVFGCEELLLEAL
jgi:hypothetical protein